MFHIMESMHLCFETIANELRVKILSALKNKQMNVNELVQQLGVERSRVSHSLQMLRDCKFVHVEQKGKQRMYEINQESPLFISKEQQHNTPGLFPLIQTHKDNICMDCYKLRAEKGECHGV